MSADGQGPTSAAEADAALDALIEAPEAPQDEAPAPEPETAAAEPDQPEPAEHPRDEHGRFTKREPTAETSETPEAPPEAEPEPATEDAAPEPEAPDAQAGDVSQFPAFKYRADGLDREFPGAVEGNGEVFFTKEAVPALRQKLALADAYPSLQSKLTRQAQAAQQQAAAAEVQVKAVFDHLTKLAEDPLAARDWWEQVQQNWPVLQAQAEAMAARQELEAERAEREQLAQQREDLTLVPQMRSLVEDAVRTWGPQAGLSPATQQRLIQRWTTTEELDRLFPRADKDDPVTGLRRGQRIGTTYQNLIARELGFLRDMLGQRQQQAAAPEVPAKRPPAPQPKPSKAPPTVSAGKGPAPKPAPKVPTFKSAAEADDWLFGDDHYKDL